MGSRLTCIPHYSRVILGQASKAVRYWRKSAAQAKSMPPMHKCEGTVRPAASNLRSVSGEVLPWVRVCESAEERFGRAAADTRAITSGQR